MEKVKGSRGFVNHQIVHDLTNIQTEIYIYNENTNTHINTKTKCAIPTNEVQIKLEKKLRNKLFFGIGLYWFQVHICGAVAMLTVTSNGETTSYCQCKAQM